MGLITNWPHARCENAFWPDDRCRIRGANGAITIQTDTKKKAAPQELSPLANSVAGWFRKLARALKICRLYKTDNAVVLQTREQALGGLERLIAENNGLAFRFTPSEIYLHKEPVVRPKPPSPRGEPISSSGEEQLPFLFYRDGIRSVRFALGVPREQLDAFFDALKLVGAGGSHDDLVTLFWQANLTHIHVESVPLEQTIFISSRAAPRDGGLSAEALGPTGLVSMGGDLLPTQGHAQASQGLQQLAGLAAAGNEIHSNLVQARGAQGLHRDTFDDWELADSFADVPKAYEELVPTMEYSISHFRSAWEDENTDDWGSQVPAVFGQLRALDPTPDMRAALVYALVTWVGGSLQQANLKETQRAIEILRTFDPDHSLSESPMAAALAELDHYALVDYLDQAEPEEQARFAALAVNLGKPAVDLAVSVLSKATESRARAAACTVLCYQCAGNPQLLAPYLGDAQGQAMLDLVFTLGQIGGAEVADLLRLASKHPEPRVRRQVVMALGGVPTAIRIPLLIDGLDTNDMPLLAATLQILAREKSPQVARALVARIAAPEFESRAEDVRWALFNALGEIADDDIVPTLAKLVNQGGWFARRTFTRSAAARTLQRIGTEKALAVLNAGLKSPSLAVRRACRDVIKGGKLS